MIPQNGCEYLRCLAKARAESGEQTLARPRASSGEEDAGPQCAEHMTMPTRGP
jgi:hypothetical protein